MGTALLVAALALIPSVARGGVSDTGPYTVELEKFSPCDGIGSLQLGMDVKLVPNNETDVAYEGDITVPYEIDSEDMTAFVRVQRWGSTGGWMPFYNQTSKDFITFYLKNFPDVFAAVLGSMGVTGKPMPPGVYHMKNFYPKNLKIGKFVVLPYGRYRIMMFHAFDDINVGCFQLIALVKEEVPSFVPGGGSKNTFKHFG